MTSSVLDDVLTLMALSVFADKRVLSQEVEAFLAGAKRVLKALGVTQTMTETKLLVWFENHRQMLHELLISPNFNSQLYQLLNRLSVLPHKEIVLDAMVEISQADDEFHVSEKALLVLAENYWASGRDAR